MITIKKFNKQKDIRDFLKEKIGVYDEGIDIMAPKTEVLNVYVPEILNQAAAILKQDMLSIGGDVAVTKDVVRFEKGNNSALIIGNEAQIIRLVNKLKLQPYGLKEISKNIEDTLKNYSKDSFKIELQGSKVLECKDMPLIMGILNITPDSFSDGGKYNNIDKAIERAELMIEEGADIIDIGAESSRPGAEPVNEADELARVLPVIKEIKKRFDIPVSVDTYKSEIARQCLEEGVDIINDISAFSLDDSMVDIVSQYNCPVVLMHMLNDPKTMQDAPDYVDVVDCIIDYFKDKIKFAQEKGIKSENIIIDPGIGFGKTTQHNLEILKRIQEFRCFGLPILVGASNKSFIGNVLDRDVFERLYGNLAVAASMAKKGINILRVHDIKVTKDVCKIMKYL